MGLLALDAGAEDLSVNVLIFYIAAFSGITLFFIISKLINSNKCLEFFGKNSLIQEFYYNGESLKDEMNKAG